MNHFRLSASVIGFIVLFAITCFVLSCKKDDTSGPTPNPDPKYYFKFQEKKYEIAKALIFYDAAWGNPNLRRFHVYLVSQGVEYDLFHNRITGDGNGLIFNLVTDNDTTFAGAAYAVHPEHSIPEVDDISSPKMMLYGDFTLMDGEITNIAGGKCVVSKTENMCKFTFNFVSAANDSITGGFTGYFEKY